MTVWRAWAGRGVWGAGKVWGPFQPGRGYAAPAPTAFQRACDLLAPIVPPPDSLEQAQRRRNYAVALRELARTQIERQPKEQHDTQVRQAEPLPLVPLRVPWRQPKADDVGALAARVPGRHPPRLQAIRDL